MKKRWLQGLVLTLTAGFLLVLSLYRSEIPPADLEALYAAGPGHEASQFVDIEGSRIHFRDEGPKGAPALVLLHGTASSLHTWDGWVEHLANRFRVLRLDLQGYGLTGPNTEKDYSIERQIRAITSLMDRRGIPSAAIAGNSLGGLIAWRLAAAHPNRAQSLILLSPAGAPPPARTDATPKRRSGFRTLDLAKVPGLRRILTRLTPRFLIRRSMEQVYGDPARVDEALVDRYYLMLRRQGNRQALVDAMSQRAPSRQRRSQQSATDSRSLADVSQPTLIQWGSKDRWIPVENGARFHQTLPDSRLIVYPDLGHVPMEEDPERTVADAEHFLQASDTP